MKSLQTLKEIALGASNEHIINFKKNGGKVILTLCAFIPPEILHAAGVLPVRIRATGSQTTEKAETQYSPTHCSFVRHTLNQAILGNYDFADGIVFATTCDHARRLYDNWIYSCKGPEWIYLMTVPHISTEGSVEYFKSDLKKLIAELEKLTGKVITHEKLENSIKLFNEQRELLNDLNELRKKKNPPISGADMLLVYQALFSIPVEDGNKLLRDLLTEAKAHEGIQNVSARLLLTTTHFEDYERICALESSGAVIVNDSSCVGSGHYATDVMLNTNDSENNEKDSDQNRLEEIIQALSERTLCRPSCPNIMDRFHDRKKAALEKAKEWNCDGIVFDHLQFCTIASSESYMMRNEALKVNMPFLVLQHELYGGGEGQVKTRIEAFVEQIKNLKKN